jgi:hypothetical protein
MFRPDAQVAQLVEQRIENPRVASSILALGTSRVMPEPLDVYAACVECGASIQHWRAKLLPIACAELVLTERHELALRVSAEEELCTLCGGDRAEIRVDRARLQ